MVTGTLQPDGLPSGFFVSGAGRMPAMPTSPQRHIRLQGASNCRDLGGYPGQGGRTLRWGLVYRSDHLGLLSDADQAELARRGINRVLDFRGVDERAATPARMPGAALHSLAIEPSVMQDMQRVVAAGLELTPARMVGLMQQLYRALVTDRAPRFAQFFQHLLAAEQPLVFHCTAGKDRTGVAAALLLLALGVPRELVYQDYLLTNDLYLRPHLPDSSTPAETLAVLWRVQPAFLDTALAEIDQHPGGLDSYLAQRLGVGPAERARLAERYLAPA